MSDTTQPSAASYETLRQHIHDALKHAQKNENQIALHDFRLDKVEAGIGELTSRVVTHEKHDASMEIIQGKLDAISDKVNTLNAAARWIIVTFFGALIIAFMGFALNGGLKP